MSRQVLRLRRVCRSKRRFATLHEADGFARSYAKAEGIDSDDFTGYRCKGCGGFHVGHTPLRVRQDLWAEKVVAR